MTLEEELYIVENLYPRAFGYLLGRCTPSVPRFTDADEMFFEPVRRDDGGGGDDDGRREGD